MTNMNQQEEWKVLYSKEQSGHNCRYSAQSFKSEHCAKRGINVLESGYVIGFAEISKIPNEVNTFEVPIQVALYYKETGLDKEFQ